MSDWEASHQVSDPLVKQFVATVNGQQRQCLVTIPREHAGDPEYAWGLIVESDLYWERFWEGADALDWTAPVEGKKLLKVRT